MPLSFGIPIGFLLFLIGAGVFLVTRWKRAALVLIGIGAAIITLTLLLIVLAVNSGM
jgi:hypothetical protein